MSKQIITFTDSISTNKTPDIKCLSQNSMPYVTVGKSICEKLTSTIKKSSNNSNNIGVHYMYYYSNVHLINGQIQLSAILPQKHQKPTLTHMYILYNVNIKAVSPKYSIKSSGMGVTRSTFLVRVWSDQPIM